MTFKTDPHDGIASGIQALAERSGFAGVSQEAVHEEYPQTLRRRRQKQERRGIFSGCLARVDLAMLLFAEQALVPVEGL